MLSKDSVVVENHLLWLGAFGDSHLEVFVHGIAQITNCEDPRNGATLVFPKRRVMAGNICNSN